MKKYCIVTYGCQMNVHESEKIAGILNGCNLESTERLQDADVIIFNTCCIRENAEHRLFGNVGSLKSLKRCNPKLIIGIVGCMTQQEGVIQQLKAKFPYIDIMLGTKNLADLQKYICARLESDENFYYCNTAENENYHSDILPMARTSYPHAYVNIIYGCNNFCTYCIVPYVRGREQSRNFGDIVFEVEKLLADGYKEITLLGQNVNSYGNDFGKTDEFARLLEVLAKLPFNYRLKFMTSHPKDLSDNVIDVIAKYDNIANSVHLPVQSGSDRILKVMNRKYTREQYIALANKLRAAIPNVALTTDILVGFPSESEQDFMDTISLVEKVRFATAFTFIYSRRNGTVADKMNEQIEESVKSERIGRLIKIQNQISSELSRINIGTVVRILVESRCSRADYMCGRTEQGRLVNIPYDQKYIGEFVDVKINKTGRASMWGEITKQ